MLAHYIRAPPIERRTHSQRLALWIAHSGTPLKPANRLGSRRLLPQERQ